MMKKSDLLQKIATLEDTPDQVKQLLQKELEKYPEDLSNEDLDKFDAFCERHEEEATQKTAKFERVAQNLADTLESSQQEYADSITELNNLMTETLDDVEAQVDEKVKAAPATGQPS